MTRTIYWYFRAASYSVAALALFAAVVLLSIAAAYPAHAETWFTSWQHPPAQFSKPYPAEHLAIYETGDTDFECRGSWGNHAGSDGRIADKACTIPPGNDYAAFAARIGFIMRHREFAARWKQDPLLCVLVLPRAGFFGVWQSEYNAARAFEEPHCWGWRETPPART